MWRQAAAALAATTATAHANLVGAVALAVALVVSLASMVLQLLTADFPTPAAASTLAAVQVVRVAELLVPKMLEVPT